MRKKIFFAFFVFLATLAQISFFPNLFPWGVSPDIVLMLVIIWSFEKKSENVLIRSFFSGFALDFVVGTPGLSAFSFLIVSSVITYLAKKFLVFQKFFSIFILALLGIMGTIINFCVVNFIVSLEKLFFTANNSWEMSLPSFNKLPLEILYNLIILEIFYWIFSKGKYFFGRREEVLKSK
jgi:rod shape-determining protein MreD